MEGVEVPTVAWPREAQARKGAAMNENPDAD